MGSRQAILLVRPTERFGRLAIHFFLCTITCLRCEHTVRRRTTLRPQTCSASQLTPRRQGRMVAFRMANARRHLLHYDGARIVVTGGAGFVGHHLVAALTGRGSTVLVLDDLSTGRADRLDPSVALEQVDICADALAPTIKAWKPSGIFHLAAQASVPLGEAHPELDLRVNGAGTLRLVAAARAARVDRIVFTSSGGAVYGERRTHASESSPLRPGSVYGIHKLLGEHYVRNSKVAHAIARPSNVYGPGQDANGEGAVVAAFMEALRAGRPLIIHGDGSQERDFLYVSDLVEALLLLGSMRRIGTWNVAAG